MTLENKIIHSIMIVVSRCEARLEPEQYLTRCGRRHVYTYVDTCIDTQDTRVKLVCEREGHTTWFEEILFI